MPRRRSPGSASRTPPAECPPRCRRTPRTGSAGSWRRCGVKSRCASATSAGSPRIRVMPAACMATSLPPPMAMPTSAAASAGASLMPSPTIATVLPAVLSWPTWAALSAGSTSASTLSMPSALGRHLRRAAVVAGEHHGGDAARLELRHAGRGTGFDRVAERQQAQRVTVACARQPRHGAACGFQFGRGGLQFGGRRRCCPASAGDCPATRFRPATSPTMPRPGSACCPRAGCGAMASAAAAASTARASGCSLPALQARRQSRNTAFRRCRRRRHAWPPRAACRRSACRSCRTPPC